ncbi:hypothetical protein Pfo_026942 [Paulownia fortunei]|nr:hypothetical protein Pfo_026942 [Paulownia fortunei]
MKINVISKKLIKPCTPTPQNLKNYKISLTDELSPLMNVAAILFYSSDDDDIKKAKRDHLEESLADILPRFYPFAGRYIKNDHLVDCSDQGAEFVEAEAVDVELQEVMGETKPGQLDDLLPCETCAADEATDPLLSIQLTTFKCGGLAISVSLSHRIVDASSVGTFIASWANASHPGPGKITINPSFDSPCLLPGKNLGYDPELQPSRTRDPSIVSRRFLFNKEAIASLRAKISPQHRKEISRNKVSRVRVVCALISQALIAVDRAKNRESRACLIAQAVNIRERTIPPLPKHSCGNLVAQAFTQSIYASEIKDIGFQELVDLLGDAIDKTIADIVEVFPGGDGGQRILIDPVTNAVERIVSGEANVFWFSDWSKFGFYEADFGWGKPVWASIGTMPAENIIVLMDNREGDGIEAWVHLNQNDMPCFEQDGEIRLFST